MDIVHQAHGALKTMISQTRQSTLNAQTLPMKVRHTDMKRKVQLEMDKKSQRKCLVTYSLFTTFVLTIQIFIPISVCKLNIERLQSD